MRRQDTGATLRMMDDTIGQVRRTLGLARDVVAFGVFFSGVALEAVGRALSEKVEAFEEEVGEARVITAADLEEADPDCRDLVAATVEYSPVAREMLAEGMRAPVDVMPRPAPLAGSVSARFARGA